MRTGTENAVSIMDTMTSEIIVLRPSELELIVEKAVEKALARVAPASEPKSSSPSVIHGRDNIKRFLNVSDRTLRDRRRRYPPPSSLTGARPFSSTRSSSMSYSAMRSV